MLHCSPSVAGVPCECMMRLQVVKHLRHFHDSRCQAVPEGSCSRLCCWHLCLQHGGTRRPARSRGDCLQVQNEPCRWTKMVACGFRTTTQSHSSMARACAALPVPAAYICSCLTKTVLKLCKVVSSCKSFTCCPPVPKVSACLLAPC